MASNDDRLDSLEERLQNHAKSFEALLALTPAREHFGSQIADGLDPSEQWNRKKQTKEQKRAAKRAKLDPANQKSALDVHREQERKRKRELGLDEAQDESLAAGATLSEPTAADKRQRQELDDDASEARRREKAEKRKEARERKKEKRNRKKAKIEAKKAAKQATNATEAPTKRPSLELSESRTDQADESDGDDDGENEDDENELIEHGAADLAQIDFSGLGASDDEDLEDDDDDNDDAAHMSSVPSTPAIESPAFDVSTNQSEASSSSSIDSHPTHDEAKSNNRSNPSQKPSSNSTSTPQISSTTTPALQQTSEKRSGNVSPKLNFPKVDPAELQERLRKRIEILRAQRKADGSDGRAPRSRQDLLDQRRKKEEQRKAHKKELRRQAKEDESRRREEQLRGSGSPLSMTLFSPRSPPQTAAAAATEPQSNNFSFTRLAFTDGSAADPALTHLADPKKKKGPQDPHTALLAAEKKQSRLAGLDDASRADLAEKDRWLHARQRAHGERVARDDTSLLKKALKRKEKQKGRSEREWKDREQAVVKGKEARQKKREGNLARRKEEKGGGGGGKGKKGGSGVTKGGKKKGRPGFEGRFKA